VISNSFFKKKVVEKFESLYDSVDDIDLFIAGVSEKKTEGALVGPTFACIIADQFLRLKRGDRYFYDLVDRPGSFTEGMCTYYLQQKSFEIVIHDDF
jgi:peroxidase